MAQTSASYPSTTYQPIERQSRYHRLENLFKRLFDILAAGAGLLLLSLVFLYITLRILRGLHFQKNPNAQGKLVQCIKGKIFDVAIDIRKGSPTFGDWVGVELSEGNNLMLYVPSSFAHGFVVLSEAADVIYKCTREYSPEDDRGIIWNDPDINIQWPIKEPSLSEKDKRLPLLRDADNNFEYPSISHLARGYDE